MRTIHCLNVNEAFTKGLLMLLECGSEEDSRAGKVLVYPDPVTTIYLYPDQRVLFHPNRDANPFFHFMEGLWMLAGRDDVEWISQYNSTIKQFSDDGVRFHGAYGHRWRNHFKNGDQLKEIISLLKREPNTRRAVLTMWDPNSDLAGSGKDLPCNNHIYFRIRNRHTQTTLDMTVCCRSNDIIWGAYGANAVHMSMLQEYVASMVGVPLGTYTQISNDFHAYVDILEKQGVIQPLPHNPYDLGQCRPYPMIKDPATWDAELGRFMGNGKALYDHFKNPFFLEVAVPMKMVWRYYKEKQFADALDFCKYIEATDWRKACEEWLKRRIENHANRKRTRPKI